MVNRYRQGIGDRHGQTDRRRPTDGRDVTRKRPRKRGPLIRYSSRQVALCPLVDMERANVIRSQSESLLG